MRSIVAVLTCLVMMATASAEMPTKKKSIEPPGGIFHPREVSVAAPIVLDVLPAPEPEPEYMAVSVKQVANEEEPTCVTGTCATGYVSSDTCSTGTCSQNTGRRLFSRLSRRR
jgi:hypothetical protein